MRTWVAILAHIGVGVLQIGLPLLTAQTSNLPIPPEAQLGIQGGFLVLQGILAKSNSNTDPNGTKLHETVKGGYVSPAPTSTSN